MGTGVIAGLTLREAVRRRTLAVGNMVEYHAYRELPYPTTILYHILIFDV
jgi:hypothetical protein